MKFALSAALALALACSAASAFAADAAAPTTAPAKTLTPQQQKMSDCSKDAKAKGLKGPERRTFMSTCLKGDSTAAAPAMTAAPAATAAATPAAKPTQQEKMKTCNADAGAKHLTGDARKTYMSTCLKSDSTAAAAH